MQNTSSQQQQTIFQQADIFNAETLKMIANIRQFFQQYKFNFNNISVEQQGKQTFLHINIVVLLK